MLIGLSGMPAAGKTTLARTLSTRFNLRPAYESIGPANPWLDAFYGEPDGMRRNALNLQLHFLATRMESLRQMRAEGGDWLLDRTWYEDAEIFARGLFEQGLMSSAEFDLYQRLYTELLHSPAARPPHLLVYLTAPLETIVDRIQLRGRPKERDTKLEYWAQLYERYERWIRTFDACPVLRLDVRQYDFLRDPYAVDNLAEHLIDILGPERVAALRGSFPAVAPPEHQAVVARRLPARAAR